MAFPIIGWAKLPKEQTRPDVFDSIARCGITVFMTCDDSTEDVLAQLDLAAEHGLQALVTDPRFTPTDDDDCVDRGLSKQHKNSQIIQQPLVSIFAMNRGWQTLPL